MRTSSDGDTEARMAGEFIMGYILKFVGWVMPAVIIFFVSRRTRTDSRKKTRGLFFYTGLSFLVSSVVLIDIMSWSGFGPASTAQVTLLTHSALFVGVLMMYLFASDMMIYLENMRWRDYLLDTFPFFLLISVFMVSTYVNFSLYPSLSVLPLIEFIDNITVFAVALTYAALGKIFRGMGSRFWFLSVISGVLFCTSIAVATYPEMLLFSGRITVAEHDAYSWMSEHVLQLTAGLIALFPTIEIRMHSEKVGVYEGAGAYAMAVNEYLGKMSIFGPDVYDVFRSALSDAGLKDGTLMVEESDWPELLEHVILASYRRFGRVAIDTAKSIDAMKKAAVDVEEFTSFGSNLRF
jgi:hypothetical protein